MHELFGEPLVRVMRGDLVESIHAIAACAMDRRGEIVYRCGAIDVPVYLRSTAKPFIAAAAVLHGAHERFALDSKELAVMAASHSGEPFHIEAVRSILNKIGLPEAALRCGVHPPYNVRAAAQLERDGIAPSAIHNNCSGKHAGILALCKVLGADPSTYLRPDNAAQQRILALCARVSDELPGSMPIAVDGCGIPVYATTLRNAARSFVRFATLEDLTKDDAHALRVVRDAMLAHPQYVAGTDEFDTRLMQVAHGSIACKAGAEGVHGSAAIGRGGLALKVIDGAARGRAPAVLAILRKLDWLDAQAYEALSSFAQPQLFNRAGTHIGQVRAVV